MNEFFYFQEPIETSRQKDRQTKANYIYKLQLTTTHKFRRYDDKKTEAKKVKS